MLAVRPCCPPILLAVCVIVEVEVALVTVEKVD